MKVGFRRPRPHGQRHGPPHPRRRPRPARLRRAWPAQTAPFGAAGATVAASLAEVCAGRDVVVTMLVEDAVGARRRARRRAACATRCRKGAIHLVMGTHGVAHDSRARGRARRERAGAGGGAGARAARPCRVGAAGIVPGGPDDSVARCLPLLEVMGKRIFRAGPKPESATAIKLANNAVLGCAMVAMAEGFALVRKYGVEPAGVPGRDGRRAVRGHGLQGLRPEDGGRKLRPGGLADHGRA